MSMVVGRNNIAAITINLISSSSWLYIYIYIHFVNVCHIYCGSQSIWDTFNYHTSGLCPNQVFAREWGLTLGTANWLPQSICHIYLQLVYFRGPEYFKTVHVVCLVLFNVCRPRDIDTYVPKKTFLTWGQNVLSRIVLDKEIGLIWNVNQWKEST